MNSDNPRRADRYVAQPSGLMLKTNLKARTDLQLSASRIRVLLTLALIASALHGGSALAGKARIEVGRFERTTRSPTFPDGGKESGLLTISNATAKAAVFDLDVTVNPVANDDGSLTRSGQVLGGEMTIRSGAGLAVYRSSNPEDKDLGVCEMTFAAKSGFVEVRQRGSCWWFGEGVDASGLYKKTDGVERGVRLVK